MNKNIIRPIAICIFHYNGRILAAEGYDTVKQEAFYRPLGGTIEFGETSQETVVRELREELNAEVKDLRFLAALENIFTYRGQQGHEIVMVYDGVFTDQSLYEQSAVHGDEDGETIKAIWIELASRGSDSPPLYPDGLPELLAGLVE